MSSRYRSLCEVEFVADRSLSHAARLVGTQQPREVRLEGLPILTESLPVEKRGRVDETDEGLRRPGLIGEESVLAQVLEASSNEYFFMRPLV